MKHFLPVITVTVKQMSVRLITIAMKGLQKMCYLLLWISISATRAALMVWACWAALAGEFCVDPDPGPKTSLSTPVSTRSRLLGARALSGSRVRSMLGLSELSWFIHGGASDMAEVLVGCADFMAETTRSSQPADAGTNSLVKTED